MRLRPLRLAASPRACSRAAPAVSSRAQEPDGAAHPPGPSRRKQGRRPGNRSDPRTRTGRKLALLDPRDRRVQLAFQLRPVLGAVYAAHYRVRALEEYVDDLHLLAAGLEAGEA